eukprot:1928743-Amphidinium_carterae.1
MEGCLTIYACDCKTQEASWRCFTGSAGCLLIQGIIQADDVLKSLDLFLHRMNLLGDTAALSRRGPHPM